ncbi:MAG: Smr/MutS family protein [Desulfovibrionaceae bacterium]|jgi:DNA mismatch repair protein MutS2|nr:Smr/MutS family protein [Desulfovibrionaceae bacterium]
MDQRTAQLLEFPKVLAELARHARSEPGALACAALAPIADPDELARTASLCREYLRWTERTAFRSGAFPELDGLLAFLERPTAVLDLDALFALKNTLAQAKGSLDALHPLLEDESGAFPLLAELAATEWPVRVWSALGRCLAPDGALKDQSSPELMSVRAEIRRIHQKCTKKAKDFILGQNISHQLQDDFITISNDRYVLPLKTNFKGQLPGIIHDYSQTGETCYFEPLFLVDLNNELQDLKQEEREAERAVMAFLTSLVRDEYGAVAGAYGLLVHLDVLGAKGSFAAALNGHVILPEDGAPLHLRDARHPLLAAERGRAGQGGRAHAKAVPAAVPVDIELRPGQRAMILSGGNAGGKTVCLKTLGLVALLAATAIPAPVAEGSALPRFDDIFVILGDEQSLEDHVSTFTAQITRLARGWETVGPRTLVLLDEFGAGTDPTQGAALAQAVVDTLLERGAWLAAATHFPALKVFAMTDARVRAASVLFDPDSKRPLFRIGYDQVGASQALAVAREHGLPEEILRRAESLMLLDSTDTSALMERLNELAVERERATRALEAERAKLREKRLKLDERFEREKGALLEEVRNASQDVLHRLKREKITHKQALKELSAARERVRTQEAEERRATNAAQAVAPQALSRGDRVRYLPWDRNGVVEETDERKGAVKIDLSGVSMWVEAADLAPAGDVAAPRRAPSGATVTVAAPVPAGLALDLRGQRADVATAELEKFLDRALLDNFTSLEIIHGRGTGALRKEVHEFLRRFPAVASYALAPEDRGGDGVTLVELR